MFSSANSMLEEKYIWKPYNLWKLYAFLVIYEDNQSVGMATMWISGVSLKSYPDQAVEQTVDKLVICDIIFLLSHCKSISRCSNIVTDLKQTIFNALWITTFTQSTSVWNISSVNSLWLSDAKWHHRFGSTLAPTMACCLTAPSYYLKYCWLIIKGDPWNSISHQLLIDIIHAKHSENYIVYGHKSALARTHIASCDTE